jgi:GTP-binding protein
VALGPGDDDPIDAFRTVRKELEEYASSLAEKQFIVALTKSDILSTQAGENAVKDLDSATGILPHLVSAVSGAGMNNLLGDLARIVEKSKQEEQSE